MAFRRALHHSTPPPPVVVPVPVVPAYVPPPQYPTAYPPAPATSQPSSYPPSGYPPTSYPTSSYPPSQGYQASTYPPPVSQPPAGYPPSSASTYPPPVSQPPAGYPPPSAVGYPVAPDPHPASAAPPASTAYNPYGVNPQAPATNAVTETKTQVPDVSAGYSSYSSSYSSSSGSSSGYKSSTGSTSHYYVKGWSPAYDPYANSCATITDTGKGSAATTSKDKGLVAASTPGSQGTADKKEEVDVKLVASKRYEELVKNCLAKNCLWEDTDFPARDSSLYYKTSPGLKPIEWKRPNEICASPKFAKGASRMDVQQGKLGDCWLLAAIADLTTNPLLFNKVVPQDQSFDKGKYTGIFRFYFWQYGRWVEVLVDDRLPTYHGKLIYMNSDQRGEFWSSLLEKAYAKLCESYEALSGGLMSESFEDFTGGMAYKVDLRSKAPPDLYARMLKAHDKGALFGCSIDSGTGNREGQLPNGLIIGHAYSITNVTYVNVQGRSQQKVPLVRVRNPWGDEHEWNKAWSDKSSEWSQVSEEEKKRIGAVGKSNDGEFWMCYDDFVREFERLEFCLLGPDSVCTSDSLYKKVWEGALLEGGWKKRVNAGGCRNYPDTFWTNPQYKIHVSADDDDPKGQGTVIIGLMQRGRRAMRKEGKDNLSIGYVVYQLADPKCGTLGRDYFDKHKIIAKSSAYVDAREVADFHKIAAGDYVIVPTTFEPNQEADFVLRIFTEKKGHNLKEIDDDHTTVAEAKGPSVAVDSAADIKREEEFYECFKKAAVKGQLDAYQLKEILDRLYAKELHVKAFSTDLCRSLVALHDLDMTGRLSFGEYKELYKDFHLIQKAFKANDKQGRGYFNSYELRSILHSIADESPGLKGLRITNATFNAVVMRYSDQDGKVFFDDFLACVSKLKTLFGTFRAKDAKSTGVAPFQIDEFIQLSVYS